MQSPSLQPGERLLAAEPDIGLAIYQSGINYRAAPTLPLVQNVGFYITDRRAILRGEIFMNLYDKDVDFWLPGHAPQPGDETIVSVSLEHGEVLGEHLRIATRADREHLLRAKDAVFQIFTANASALAKHFPVELLKKTAQI
ncbi:MAG: hypothetical protein JNM76_08575 [Betaproteobacteria bacterium]|nr:hypothetical protein [Betaproteobacteria bacterium]